MIWLLVKYILTAALKDRLFLGLLVVIAVAISVSIFLGSSALTEKDQFSLVFAAGGLRIAGLMTLILFTVFYIRKSFETRDVEYLLSRPLSRFQFLVAHNIAISLLASFMALLVTVALFLMPSNSKDIEDFGMWGISIWVEYIIVANVALFFALMLSSAVISALAVMAFYVLSRLIGGILGIVTSSYDIGSMIVLEKIMLLVSIFIPRLDLMGQTSWLVYGDAQINDLFFALTQGVVFCGFVFAISLWDLKRKQF